MDAGIQLTKVIVVMEIIIDDIASSWLDGLEKMIDTNFFLGKIDLGITNYLPHL